MNDRAILRGTGVDLHLDPVPGSGLRTGLERALREAVRDGRLPPDTRLPSSRTLAADLGIARNTVADAYGQLVAEGWLTARQGSGTRVADVRAATPPARTSRRVGRAAVPASPEALARAGLVDLPAHTGLPFDLRPGTPDLSSFPRAAWLTATRQALRRAPNEAFGYGDPRGRPELRRELATYLARTRGVRADPELMLICSGFVQAVGLVGRALRAAGARRTAVEALGHPDTAAVLRGTGLTTVEVPVDADGACVDALGDADAVLLTPSHQYPSGVRLSPARRTAVVEWARRTGGIVVEDDYDGEFRYDRQAVGALQGLDPEVVVYAGTASKSLAPGLRLAWLVLPERLLEPVTLHKRLADHLSPVIEQLTLTEMITSGAYDRHVRRMRQHYRRRRDRLVEALARHAPAARVSGIAAGLHAVVELPPGSPPPSTIVARAAAIGLALAGPTYYGVLPVGGELGAPGSGSPGSGVTGSGVPGSGVTGSGVTGSGAGSSGDGAGALVVGFGTPPEHAFGGALERLCAVLAEAGGRAAEAGSRAAKAGSRTAKGGR